MQAKKKISNQSSFFFSLEDTLSARYSLYILNNRVDWRLFEIAVSPMYCLDNGCPVKPIRLMVSLLIMKHIRNVSDESAVEQWDRFNG
ncbi:hypothetical protein [Sphingobacterium sp. JB170]|uniref:hypothetical protein n=1 Tax=Sphingobacterium sp. JB170 TaxID=1434842 RepID=UPI0015C616A6|nr:hypothetical protein [Sphingobacterium sp. JB170]